MTARLLLAQLTTFVFLMQMLGSAWAMYGSAGHHLAGGLASPDAAGVKSHKAHPSASQEKSPCRHRAGLAIPSSEAGWERLHSEPLLTADNQLDHECTCSAICHAGVDVLILTGVHVLVGSPCGVSTDAILQQDFIAAVPLKPPRA